mmetsp:Transcript_18877/g.58136  ORF Transcript_18877/g.58136 Transcript_18877/m.58136 type:complete len:342 (+) Transcript_18877:111-1136(+)
MTFGDISLGKPSVAGSGWLGYGAMGLTAFYGEPVSDEHAFEVLKSAYDGGCRHFDTAEVYKSGKMGEYADTDVYNEAVVGKFLATVPRDTFTIATKYWPRDEACDYETVKAACEASLKRLGLPYVDLYYTHRVLSLEMAKNFAVAAKKLKEEGLIKNIGYSEITGAWLKECHAIAPVAAVQQEWSLITRSLETELVPACADLGVTVVAYSPLGRNLLTGVVTETPTDWRASNPRYSPENLQKNVELVKSVEAIAEKKGCTAAQLSLAWLFWKAKALNVAVLPIPGTTKLTNLASNLGAVDVSLDDAEMAVLEDIASKVAGERGNEDYMSRGIEAHHAKSEL